MGQGQAKNKKPVRHLFGTDGVRGTANQDPMTSEMALNLGRAMARVLHDTVALPSEESGRS
ncbi:MAG: phosphoglucosamine mutase, partial [Deltaproteobacteria bacterium]|nr:phosphoglucosamine mutase [Deltaproteobacteria bacterium]